MATYNVNKGIGKEVEFKGLCAQYLFLFAGGLLGIFILFVVMYLLGVPTGICISTGIIAATALIWSVYRLNDKYGKHGLMKITAIKRYPRRIIHRKAVRRILSEYSKTDPLKD